MKIRITKALVRGWDTHVRGLLLSSDGQWLTNGNWMIREDYCDKRHPEPHPAKVVEADNVLSPSYFKAEHCLRREKDDPEEPWVGFATDATPALIWLRREYVEMLGALDARSASGDPTEPVCFFDGDTLVALLMPTCAIYGNDRFSS